MAGEIYEIERVLPCPFLKKTLACVDCRFCDQRKNVCTNMEEIIDHIEKQIDSMGFVNFESILGKAVKEFLNNELRNRKIVIE